VREAEQIAACRPGNADAIGAKGLARVPNSG
jgi:hypothetical protein